VGSVRSAIAAWTWAKEIADDPKPFMDEISSRFSNPCPTSTPSPPSMDVVGGQVSNPYPLLSDTASPPFTDAIGGQVSPCPVPCETPPTLHPNRNPPIGLKGRPDLEADERVFVFFGRPGTGKNILLNACIGKSVFRAGRDPRLQALDLNLVQAQHNGCTYIPFNFPAVSDARQRTRTMQLFSCMIQNARILKMIFVCTMDRDAGHINVADLDIIKLVHESLQLSKDGYSIFVNKNSKNFMMKRDKSAVKSEINDMLETRSVSKTCHVYFASVLDELEDVDDGSMEVNPEMQTFLRDAPEKQINQEIVTLDTGDAVLDSLMQPETSNQLDAVSEKNWETKQENKQVAENEEVFELPWIEHQSKRNRRRAGRARG
jgi:hypothetical protein